MKIKKEESSGIYSTIEYPTPDGKVTRHCPKRNYWGNLSEKDTYLEGETSSSDYDYSNFDYEDDHDSYYDENSYK